MKVKAKDLYRILRGAVNTPLAECGYKPDKVTGAGWCKASDGKALRVWFQCDKNGWDDEWGATFTVHFETEALGDSSEVDEIESFERIGYLLEGFDELDELRKRNNAVIESLPGTLEGTAELTTLDDGSVFPIIGYVVDTEPAVKGRDIWLHYGSVADVENWGAFFREHLPRLCEMYEKGERSALGEARSRFNKAMARIQNEPDRKLKVQILEGYIKNESDPGYVEAAQNLIAEFESRQ